MGIVVSNSRLDDIEWYTVLPAASTFQYGYQSDLVGVGVSYGWLRGAGLPSERSGRRQDRIERTETDGNGFRRGEERWIWVFGGLVNYIRLLLHLLAKVSFVTCMSTQTGGQPINPSTHSSIHRSTRHSRQKQQCQSVGFSQILKNA